VGSQKGCGQRAQARGEFRGEAPSYEERLILIALSSKWRLLFVVHAEVGRDAIGIISARKASPAQRRIYD